MTDNDIIVIINNIRLKLALILTPPIILVKGSDDIDGDSLLLLVVVLVVVVAVPQTLIVRTKTIDLPLRTAPVFFLPSFSLSLSLSLLLDSIFFFFFFYTDFFSLLTVFLYRSCFALLCLNLFVSRVEWLSSLSPLFSGFYSILLFSKKIANQIYLKTKKSFLPIVLCVSSSLPTCSMPSNLS
jgi:hypothetical protein